MKTLAIVLTLVAVASLAGCGQASNEPAANADAMANSVAPDVATVTVDCPVADDAGKLQIAPGLTATVAKKGYGRRAFSGDYADVHTTLWLYDEKSEGGRGTEIWTSGGTQPFQFQLGADQVIQGWDMGVPCMLIGETRELIIAADLAYGATGKPPVPPNASLLFNIELVKLTSPDQ